MTDIEIAQSVKMQKITDVAARIGLFDDAVVQYGKTKAKINLSECPEIKDKKDGKLILVTAITPTPAGEGKTTTSIGLLDGLCALNKKAVAALREPSLGPVFGIKGGATGGGYSQIVPMEEINLHFTGDFHALTSANNLLAAMIDNHIHQGNLLNLDPENILWKRALDMNDRSLRTITIGQGGKANGVERPDGFDITVASEIMAILCLATDLADLKKRCGAITIGYTYDKKPVTAADLHAEGAMAALLKEAIKPNLVQTLEGNPVLVHGGPFANIAHGCNSIIATKAALKLADYVVTEAGFAADLGAEKFFDIKCREASLTPDAVVLVATIRALKYHGGVNKEELNKENVEALKAGCPNLFQHAANIQKVYGLPVLVCINSFPTDTEEETRVLFDECEKQNLKVVISEGWAKGSKGTLELAKAVVDLCEEENHFDYAYPLDLTLQEKMEMLAKKVYRADGVDYSEEALAQIQMIEEMGYGHYPICVAKTQSSFSDNAKLLNAPKNFRMHVRGAKVCTGARFVVILCGNIMTMPGLPKVPAAEKIDIDENGVISGLY